MNVSLAENAAAVAAVAPAATTPSSNSAKTFLSFSFQEPRVELLAVLLGCWQPFLLHSAESSCCETAQWVRGELMACADAESSIVPVLR